MHCLKISKMSQCQPGLKWKRHLYTAPMKPNTKRAEHSLLHTHRFVGKMGHSSDGPKLCTCFRQLCFMPGNWPLLSPCSCLCPPISLNYESKATGVASWLLFFGEVHQRFGGGVESHSSGVRGLLRAIALCSETWDRHPQSKAAQCICKGW